VHDGASSTIPEKSSHEEVLIAGGLPVLNLLCLCVKLNIKYWEIVAIRSFVMT